MNEEEMRERLKQMFEKLSESSESCEPDKLPDIAKAMLDIYKIFRTIKL